MSSRLLAQRLESCAHNNGIDTGEFAAQKSSKSTGAAEVPQKFSAMQPTIATCWSFPRQVLMYDNVELSQELKPGTALSSAEGFQRERGNRGSRVFTISTANNGDIPDFSVTLLNPAYVFWIRKIRIVTYNFHVACILGIIVRGEFNIAAVQAVPSQFPKYRGRAIPQSRGRYCQCTSERFHQSAHVHG